MCISSNLSIMAKNNNIIPLNFRRNLKYAVTVYRLINAELIGYFFRDSFLFQN